IGITRKELANYKARTTDCFDIGCLSIAAVSGPPGDWRKHPTPAFDEPENVTGPKTWPDSSVTTAAAAVSRYIFGDDGYGEAIEGARDDEPTLIMVISKDVAGQDASTNAIVHEPRVMDDAIAEMWAQRVVMGPAVRWRIMPVYRPGRQ